MITFVDDRSGRLKRCLVQIKSGKVSSRDIRDLKGTVQGKAELGLFVTLEPPTPEMIREAWEAGFYRPTEFDRDYPRIQIITIEELLAGKEPRLPAQWETFRPSGRIKPAPPRQAGISLAAAPTAPIRAITSVEVTDTV